MTEPTPALPDLCEGMLDKPTLDRLVTDLEALAKIDEVLLKGGEIQMAERSSLSLERAVELLWNRQTRGVQVRYRWDGDTWLDTMLRLPDGVRLVRMRAEI